MSLRIQLARFKRSGIICGALTVLLGLLLHNRFGIGLTNRSYDYLFTARPSAPVNEAVIIYMDEDSHKTLHQLHNAAWDRSLHARLLNRLTADGARAVVFDVVFSDPGPDRSADELLARAIQQNGRVVLAADATPAGYNTSVVIGKKYVPPDPVLGDQAAALGLVELDADEGFVVRRNFTGSPDDQFPSLSWATAELLNATVTQDPRQRFVIRWLNYYGPPRTIPNVSYDRALDTNAVPAGFFRGKVVFIGALAETGFSGQRKDSFPTPYSSWVSYRPRQKEVLPFMPGVEIHATQFLNLMRGDWLTRAPFRVEKLLFVGLFGLLFGYGLIQLRPTAATLSALSAVIGVGVGAYLLFVHSRFWFPWLIVIAQIFFAWLGSVLFNSIQLYVQKRLLEHSLALHLPRGRIKQFVRRPELLKPGAVKQMLSIMFTDIENFTKLSEGMDSDDLARIMNEYFETTIPCVHQSEGTVIKLIGDAILAVWNAPDQQPNHRELACRAAILLNNQDVKFTGKQGGLKLRTRIGIHTGLANVGNFGSTTRIDYTALGENVNLASRMEGLNKYLGTDILITRETQEGASGKITTRFAGRFRLKGFEKAVEVYELVGLGDQAEPTRAWREAFAQALEAFQRRNFDGAEAAFRCALKMRTHDDGPARFYLQQIAELRLHSPAPDWAGEIELKDK